jgi:arabinofuranosyltransferase
LRWLTLLTAAAVPGTLFLDWFEVAGTGRFSGWESFHRTDLLLVALCVGVMVCAVFPRWRGAGLVRIVLAGAAVAVIAGELIDPPAGSEVTTVRFGGKAAVVAAGGLLALTLLAVRQRFGAARRAEVWALLLLPSALLAVQGWAHRWTNDDAFINFRVVDQLLAGNGPVFNAGERVEPYTSAVWLAVLAAVHGVLGFAALEWIAVGLGLALTVAGLAAATIAARLLHDERSGLVLPVGALVFAALPPAWDYATSGLETGLSFGWLGGVFLALVAAERNPAWAHRRRWRPSRLDLLAVVIGLGPLVRPDFAVFSAAFFVALLAVQRPTSVRAALRPLLLAVALPAAYQLFRMGYFAMLVPNTALAKEAGLSRWGQGAAYAWDTLGTYWLLVPLAVLGAWLASRLPDLARRSRTDLLLTLLPVLAGALHIAYVIKVGGDFMHGRLMLPGLFALLMPVAALPISPHRATASLAAAAAVAVWAAIAATEFRAPYDGTFTLSDRGISDESATYEINSDKKNPVTLEDHRGHALARLGAEARRRAELGEAVLLEQEESLYEIPSEPGLPQPTIVYAGGIGLIGYAAGPEVRVVDKLGLADPIASRLRLEQRGRPGHEKEMEYAWAIARFSDPDSLSVGIPPGCSGCRERRLEAKDGVIAAEKALPCGILHDVIVAVTEPISLSRFLENLAFSPKATAARFAAQPAAAARELCD